MWNELELTGRTRSHVIQLNNPRFAVNKEVYQPFCELQNAAQKDGFTLFPFSAFRGFETQLKIWNGKFNGQKPLYDIHGVPRDYSQLNSEDEIIDCILNWSALPGASRHQWGTEIDVVDLTKAPENYHVQLLPQETVKGGVFYDLHLWLNENIEKYGFFRPYGMHQGGMYPEPWHLSYWPVANRMLQSLTVDMLEDALKSADMSGKHRVLERLPELFKNHVQNICLPLTGLNEAKT
ncbi:MAG: M15 family metallopeptidase [Limnobaculum xujianqingii]